MGRPIKRRFFGVNRTTDAGGEGITSINITAKGNNYSQGATITVAASPIGGTRATGTITPYTPAQFTNLSITSTAVTEAGTGYLTAPAVTLVKPANVAVVASAFSGNLAGNILTVASTTGLFVGMHTVSNLATTAHIKTIWSGNGNVEMSAGATSTFVAGSVVFYDRGSGATFTTTLAAAVTTGNTIQANAWIYGGVVGSQADIVSQRSSRRYRVSNTDGTNVCRLPFATETGLANTYQGPFAANVMTITATDSTGGTYWVTKLDGRTATITPGGSGPGSQFAANAQAIWSMNAAVVNTTVKLATND
jgi:hypothetical protein